MKIPSETFQYSYVIFVGSYNAPAYQKYIKENKLDEKGVQIIQRDISPETCAIVVPVKDYVQIEKNLFHLNIGGGFWGQHGLGYRGEYWSIFENN